MTDALAASRLPDLPNAGYATRTQKALSDAMQELIRGLERDRLLLLEIVIAGHKLWRKRFKGAYRSIKADDELADAVFGYLVLLAGPNPDAQKAILEGVLRQQQQQTWDKRLSTVLKFSKERRDLKEAIDRELRKPKRHTVS